MIPEKVKDKKKIITNFLLRSDRCSSQPQMSVFPLAHFVLKDWDPFLHSCWLKTAKKGTQFHWHVAAELSYFPGSTENVSFGQGPNGRATRVQEDQGERKTNCILEGRDGRGGKPVSELRKRTHLPTTQFSNADLALNPGPDRATLENKGKEMERTRSNMRSGMAGPCRKMFLGFMWKWINSA